MKDRLLSLLIAAVIACAILLLLPPGAASRLSSLARLILRPAQAWTDCAARMARAALGDPREAEHPEASPEELRAALAHAQLERDTAYKDLEDLRQDLRTQNLAADAYRNLFTLAIGRVIKRDPLVSYYDTITISLGSNDGLKTGQYVVAIPENHPAPDSRPELIGIITEVGPTSAQAMLVTHREFSVSCAIPQRHVTGVLVGASYTHPNGYAIEKPLSRLVLANPSGREFETIREGDQIYTSGLGNEENGLNGIHIGTVSETAQSEDGMPIVLMHPAAALWNFSHVMVILGRGRR